jgi:hypothetical protein
MKSPAPTSVWALAFDHAKPFAIVGFAFQCIASNNQEQEEQ